MCLCFSFVDKAWMTDVVGKPDYVCPALSERRDSTQVNTSKAPNHGDKHTLTGGEERGGGAGRKGATGPILCLGRQGLLLQC